jgi:hypothetical protein
VLFVDVCIRMFVRFSRLCSRRMEPFGSLLPAVSCGEWGLAAQCSPPFHPAVCAWAAQWFLRGHFLCLCLCVLFGGLGTHSLKRPVAMAYVSKGFHEVGSQVRVAQSGAKLGCGVLGEREM